MSEALRKLVSVPSSTSSAALRSIPRQLPVAEVAQPNGAQPGGAQPNGVQPGGAQPDGAQPGGAQPEQAFAALLPSGRLVELVGAEGVAARTTTALAVIAHAQAAGEPAVWIQLEGGGLFPPDVAEAGVDLDALIVVHIPVAAGAAGLARAAELLLRSNGFGVVVVDLSAGVPPGDAWPGRLAGLARQHDLRLIVLTDKSARRGSVGPLVAVRVEAARRRVGAGRWAVDAHVLRNKSGAQLESAPLLLRGPRGAQ